MSSLRDILEKQGKRKVVKRSGKCFYIGILILFLIIICIIILIVQVASTKQIARRANVSNV